MTSIKTHIQSEKGLQATQNQDYAIDYVCSQGHLWVVADGEGEKGVRAARLVADTLRLYIEDNTAPSTTELLRKAIMHTNEVLQKQMLLSEGVVALKDKEQLCVAIFGKSKALKFSKKQLEDVSNINPVLGQQSVLQAQISTLPIVAGSKILLMSKGVFLQLSIDKITEILQDQKLDHTQSILQATLQAGGQYNATLTLIAFESIHRAKNIGKSWKILRPYLFPLLLLGVVVGFFTVAHFSQQSEKNKEEETKSLIQIQDQNLKRRKDSLVKVDNKKDTLLIHTFVKGETVGIVARKYGTTTEAIIEANILDDKASVAVGQKLKVNAKMVYLNPREQTLQEIYENTFKRWEKLGVSIESIRKANQPASLTGKLRKGQKIIIPALKTEKKP